VHAGVVLPGAGVMAASLDVTLTNVSSQPCSFPAQPALSGITDSGTLVPITYQHPQERHPGAFVLPAGASAYSSMRFGSCDSVPRADRVPVRAIGVHLASDTTLTVSTGMDIICSRASDFSAQSSVTP
jgi:hypothetical protein